MLSQVIKRHLLTKSSFVFMSQRFFAAAPKNLDNLSITELNQIGHSNLAQTKLIDYSQFAIPNVHGLPSKKSSFKNFEDQINEQFDIKQTAPTTRESTRVGLLGYKMGCTHFWDKWGQITPCTVIQIDRCQVVQVKSKQKDGRDAIQIGIGQQRLKSLRKPQAGHFLKYNLPPKADLAEFPVSPENFLPVGYCLGPRHFKIGQFVDVKAVSIGKGFQGTMKRWNFGGQNASHGNSLSHRHPGSIGNREYPGKVFKGKKMAGHMGNHFVTTLNQMIVKIDTERSLLYIRGAVPGPISSLVRIRDAVKKIDKQYLTLDYPTWIPPESEDEYKKLPKLLVYEGAKIDPFEDYYHENDVVSGKDQEDD